MLNPLTEIARDHTIATALFVVMAATLLFEFVRMARTRGGQTQRKDALVPALATASLTAYMDLRGRPDTRTPEQRRTDEEFRRMVETYHRED